MSQATEQRIPSLEPDEMARRVAEYRALGFERKAMPHIIYHPPWDICPWPGCGFRIAGIDFQLEKGDPAAHSRQLSAWWLGSGLVGRCPSCNQYVLFGFNNKRCIEDPPSADLVVLPDDWYQRAYVPKL